MNISFPSAARIARAFTAGRDRSARGIRILGYPVLAPLCLVVSGCVCTAAPAGNPSPGSAKPLPEGVYYALPRGTLIVTLKAESSFELAQQQGGVPYASPTFKVTGAEVTAVTEPDPATGYFLSTESGFWKTSGFALELSPEGYPQQGSVTEAGVGYTVISHLRDALSVATPVLQALASASIGILAVEKTDGTVPEAVWAAQLFRDETDKLLRIARLQQTVREHPGLDDADKKLRDTALQEIVGLRAELTQEVTAEFRIEVQRTSDLQLMATVRPVRVPELKRTGVVTMTSLPAPLTVTYRRGLVATASIEAFGPLATMPNSAAVPEPGSSSNRLVVRLPAPCRFGFKVRTAPVVGVDSPAGSRLSEPKAGADAAVFDNRFVMLPQAGPLTALSPDARAFRERTVAMTYHESTGSLAKISVTDKGPGEAAKEIKESIAALGTALKKPEPPSETDQLNARAGLLDAKLRLAKAEEALRAFTDKPADRSGG